MDPIHAALKIGKYAVALKFASLTPADTSPIKIKPIEAVEPDTRGTVARLSQELPPVRPNSYNNYPFAPGHDIVRDKPKEQYQADFMHNLGHHMGGYGSMAGRAALGGLGAYALSRIAGGLFGGGEDEEAGGSFPWLSTLAGAGLGAVGVPALMAYLRTPSTTRVPTGFSGDVNFPPTGPAGPGPGPRLQA